MAKSVGFWNIANILSLSRIPLGIICATLILLDMYYAAIFVGILTGITDYFDGYFAKKRKMVTKIGGIIDPATDKLFVIVVLAALTVKLNIALWKPLLILSREIVEFSMAVIFFIIRYKPNIELKARFLGKIVTTLQFFALLVIMLNLQYQNILIYILVIMTAVALADYIRLIIKSR